MRCSVTLLTFLPPFTLIPILISTNLNSRPNQGESCVHNVRHLPKGPRMLTVCAYISLKEQREPNNQARQESGFAPILPRKKTLAKIVREKKSSPRVLLLRKGSSSVLCRNSGKLSNKHCPSLSIIRIRNPHFLNI